MGEILIAIGFFSVGFVAGMIYLADRLRKNLKEDLKHKRYIVYEFEK